MDLKLTGAEAARFDQAAGVTDHQGAALLIDLGMSEALHDDFRTHAGGIPHGDGDDRFGHVSSSVRRWGCAAVLG